MKIPTKWLSNVDWAKVLTLTWGSGTTAYATQMAMSVQVGGIHPPQWLVFGYAAITALGTFISSILNTQKGLPHASISPTVDQPETLAPKVGNVSKPQTNVGVRALEDLGKAELLELLRAKLQPAEEGG